MSDFATLALIAVLAAVQSVFGVGVLIFGTPILLLAGHDFERVLSILLPASLTISTLQILLDRNLSGAAFRSFTVLLVPTAALGTVFALVVEIPRIDLLVSVVLIVTAYFRVSERRRVHLVNLARRYGRSMLIVVGTVHGLTNMGGSLLEAYVSSLHNQKTSMRQNVALGYAILASVQLAALVAFQRLLFSPMNMLAAVVAGFVFLTAGRYFFSTLPEQTYRNLVCAVMICVAAALLAKRIVVTAVT